MERRLITTREPFAGQLETPNLEMPVRRHPKSGHLYTKEKRVAVCAAHAEYREQGPLHSLKLRWERNARGM